MSRMKKPINKPSVPVTSTTPENKEPVNISLRLAPGLSQKLEKYCSMIGASKNGVISVAVSDFLDSRL